MSQHTELSEQMPRVVEAEAYTLVEYALPKDTVLTPKDMHWFDLPAEALKRQHLGLILSGKLPIWLYVYLAHKAHTFAWLATMDPRQGGGVVVERHVAAAPLIGEVVPVPAPPAE